MNWKAAVVVHILAILYVIIGGLIFHAIENQAETDARVNITSALVDFLDRNPCIKDDDFYNTLQTIYTAYKKGVLTIGNATSPANWDLYNSIFFSVTVVTTIGYGNLSPSTDAGRSFCVFYALIGIPLTLISISLVSDQLTRLVKYIRIRVFKCCCSHCTCCSERFKMITTALIVTIIGMTLFTYIPAIIFHFIEGWTYNEAVYYTFVTLLTVGFGDYVAGEIRRVSDLPVVSDEKSFAAALKGASDTFAYRGLYRLMIAAWIAIGLSWCASCVGHVQEAYTDCIKKTETAIDTVVERHKAAEHYRNEEKRRSHEDTSDRTASRDADVNYADNYSMNSSTDRSTSKYDNIRAGRENGRVTTEAEKERNSP